MSNEERINEMNSRQEDIESSSGSNTMCLAKWLQTTIHLQHGHTHSCHHPPVHKIQLNEIINNPSGLHNTSIKKQERLQMLNGDKPKGCDYCWRVENMGHTSDRVYKSTDMEWSYPNMDRVLKAGANGNVMPSYVEISFENTCNLKCMYCTPDVSSKWLDEIKKHGPYPTQYKIGDLDYLRKVKKYPLSPYDDNPYMDAFWEWFPELYKNVQVLRITGGEPLLSKHMWRLFDWIIENPNPELTLVINSNMDVPSRLIDKLIDYSNKIHGKLKTFEVYTSTEATGKQAEYIRYGMNYKRFMANCNRFLSETSWNLNFMVTFNALSITSFVDFIQDVVNLRATYNPHKGVNRIGMMISYLRWPRFMEVRMLPKEIKDDYSVILKDAIRQFPPDDSNICNGCFYLEEVDQMDRLVDFMNQEPDNYAVDIIDFKKYFDEYDKRKRLSFTETFPELKEMVQ